MSVCNQQCNANEELSHDRLFANPGVTYSTHSARNTAKYDTIL